MNLNLKIYRSIKYLNKTTNICRNPKIRIGDRVCVVRGTNKGFVSVVLGIIGKHAKLENLFKVSVASKKYFERNGNKKIKVRKYIKICVDNLCHVNNSNKIVSVKKQDSVVVNGKTFKKCIVDSDGNVVDNFVNKVIVKRQMKKQKEQDLKQQKQIENEQNNTNNTLQNGNNIVTNTIENNTENVSNNGNNNLTTENNNNIVSNNSDNKTQNNNNN